MQRNIIILRHKGQLVPAGFLDLLAKEAITSVSTLVHADNQFLIDKVEGHMSLQEFNETQEHYKDFLSFNVLGVDYPEGYQTDDIQPFSLFEKDGSPVLTAFAEGSFPGFYQEKSAHTNEFFLANFLTEQIKPIYEQMKGNLPMVMAKLREPQFKMMAEMAIINKGLITLASSDGDIITFQKGSPITEFPWGWTSDTLGYEEKSYPEQKAEPEQPKGMLARLAAKASGVPAVGGRKQEATPVPEKKENAPAPSAVAPTASVIKLPEKGESRKIKCPPDVKGNKDIRQWYNDNAGFLPQNWKVRPEVETKLPIKDFQQLAEVVKPAETAVKPVVAEKDVSTHNIPAAASTEAERVAKPSQNEERKIKSLSIPKEELELIKDMMKNGVAVGAVDKDGKTITNPADIKNFEKPTPLLTEQSKMQSVVPTFTWSHDALHEMLEKAPSAFFALALQWRMVALNKSLATPQVQHTTTAAHSGVPQIGGRRAAG